MSNELDRLPLWLWRINLRACGALGGAMSPYAWVRRWWRAL